MSNQDNTTVDVTRIKFWHLPKRTPTIILFITMAVLLALRGIYLGYNMAGMYIFPIIVIFSLFVLNTIIKGKTVNFFSDHIEVSYLLFFRKKWKEKYENIIGYKTREYNYRGRFQEVIVELKNGRSLRIEERHPAHKISDFVLRLEKHGVIGEINPEDMFSVSSFAEAFRMKQPYL